MLLDRAVDQVLEQCVDFDPDKDYARRRASDSRSVWIEPSARHVTSEEVLVEEEQVLSWAIDNQLDPLELSTTVRSDGLDVMQAEAASTVAARYPRRRVHRGRQRAGSIVGDGGRRAVEQRQQRPSPGQPTATHLPGGYH